MVNLDEKILSRILEETRPSFQLTNKHSLNLGFGWLYYGFVRALRPQRVLAIGSKRGFAPVCLALGLAHNSGHTITHISCYETLLATSRVEDLVFIDPSKNCHCNDVDHSFGEGFWDDASATQKWFESFGCPVRHLLCESDTFFETNKDKFDLVFLDGSHTYEQAKRDLENAYRTLNAGGLILMHDVHPDVMLLDASFGSQQAFYEFSKTTASKTMIPIFPGLGIIFDLRLSEISRFIDPR